MRISDWSSDVCSSDLRQERQHGPRAAAAVQSNDSRTGIRQALAGILRCQAFARLCGAMESQRDDRGKPALQDNVEGDERFPYIAEGFANNIIHAGFAGPSHMLLEPVPQRALGTRVRRIIAVGLADVARE